MLGKRELLEGLFDSRIGPWLYGRRTAELFRADLDVYGRFYSWQKGNMEVFGDSYAAIGIFPLPGMNALFSSVYFVLDLCLRPGWNWRRVSARGSTVEHPATAQPCALLDRRGWEVTRLPVDAYCRLDPSAAQAFTRGDTALVTAMLANNETGTLMPVRALSGIAHAKGALMHTDAAQAVGKIAVRVRDLDVDLLSVAGHKLYAPKGVGALYIRKGTPLQPVLLGASHERGLRPGTENVASIVGLGKACHVAARDQEREGVRLRGLRDELWARLGAAVPGIKLNGHSSERLPNTLNVSFPGVSGSSILQV